MPDDDPTRTFLDQTVPRDDAWDGREPEEGPARPRHVQHPTSDEPLTAKERRKETFKRAAWTLGPSAAFVAGAALSNDDDTDDDVQTDFTGGVDSGA